MTNKRKKTLRSHFLSSAPESRAGILEVFTKAAPKEELEFLQALNRGEDPEAGLPTKLAEKSAAPKSSGKQKEDTK